jgi:hypothetical protein
MLLVRFMLTYTSVFITVDKDAYVVFSRLGDLLR